MSYATYTTEVIVCGSVFNNSADRSYLLFTKDAGMLFAAARSVREERSKQRQALQDFSRARVSLVKGKTGWRIGSVEALGNPFLSASNRSIRHGATRVVRLIRRYVHGESALPELYQDTVETLCLLESIPEHSRELLLEVFQIRLLKNLGYVASASSLSDILSTNTVHEACQVCTDKHRTLIEALTNQASTASHL